MYIIRCVLMRWTQWDHAQCCSSFLCEAIGKNILVTLDDVTWPHGWHIAKIASRESGMVMTDVIHDMGCYYDEYLSKMSQLIFPPSGQEIDLTLGHRYKKSEIYKLYVSNGSWYPASFKTLSHLLWLWRGLKVAKWWCEVGSFKLIWWPDLSS